MPRCIFIHSIRCKYEECVRPFCSGMNFFRSNSLVVLSHICEWLGRWSFCSKIHASYETITGIWFWYTINTLFSSNSRTFSFKTRHKSSQLIPVCIFSSARVRELFFRGPTPLFFFFLSLGLNGFYIFDYKGNNCTRNTRALRVHFENKSKRKLRVAGQCFRSRGSLILWRSYRILTAR